MIYSINGILEHIFEDSIVVCASGLSYQIFVSDFCKADLPECGQMALIYTYFHVREDHQLLFGFSSLQDKHLFLNLISVSGVGPKVALKILSTLPYTRVISAILESNIPTLTSVSGVGKKMAERLILELKDALSKSVKDSPTLFATEIAFQQANPLEKDLSLALKSLGYSQDEIKQALSLALPQLSTGSSLESGIKSALKFL